MGSKVGTKSIAQIAYELRDPETGAWPTAMQVWKATYQKADGTWSIPSGEETLAQLYEVAQTHQEQISSAPVPMVEHFAVVLGRKANHSRGVGIRAINRVAEERIRLLEQIEAADQGAAAAQARAEAADQRAEAAEQCAQAMQEQVTTMAQSNAEIREEQQSQRSELNCLRGTQNQDVADLVRLQVEQQMAGIFARINSQPSDNSQANTDGEEQ